MALFSEQQILEQEGVIRLSVFIAVFILMALAETLSPKKQRQMPRHKRWVTNWALVIVNGIALRYLTPILAIGMAEVVMAKQWGLLNLLQLPFLSQIILAIVMLDLLIYFQHVVSHKVPIFWRFHRVHHVDRDIDVTTGFRFHTVEIVLSMLFKLACVFVLGAPVIAVFIFELILNGAALFNHSNVRIPFKIDRLFRWVIVTPDMHRVHHSVIPKETNSNYGFFLSIWDKLFKSYTEQPKEGHDSMVIGLAEYQNEKPSSLVWSLLFPFEKNNKPTER